MAKELTVTPVGILTGFVALEKPSVKFDNNGIYCCQVAFTGADAKDMKRKINQLMDHSFTTGSKSGIKRMVL